MKKSFYIMLLLWFFLLSACRPEPMETQVPAQEQSLFAAREVPFHFELSETQNLYLLDARENHLLFTVWDKATDDENLNVLHYSTSVFIFNMDTGKVEATWIPDIIQQFQSGVLTSDTTALCSVCTDVEDPVGRADTMVALTNEMETIMTLGGPVEDLCRTEDGKIIVVYSEFESETVEYGVVCIDNGIVTKDYDFINGLLNSGSISSFGDKLCYISEKDGTSWFVTVDEEGELYRNKFDSETEKLDSWCLTSNGVLASMMSDAGHKLVLLNPDGSRIVMDRSGDDSALYRLNANAQGGLAVDYRFRLHGFTQEGTEITITMNPCGEEFADQMTGAISIFRCNEDSFIVFCNENQRLFLIGPD